MGVISVKERDQVKDLKFELQQIWENLKCKICNFEATKSNQTGTRNPLLRDYCTEHFSKPMTEVAGKEIVDNFCQRCNTKFSPSSKIERLMHLGYKHAALYPYLKEGSNIDLTPFAAKDIIVKEMAVFPFEECDKNFKTKWLPKAHMVYHIDERPFPARCVIKLSKIRGILKCTLEYTVEKGLTTAIIVDTLVPIVVLFVNHKKAYHSDGSFSCKDCKRNSSPSGT